MDGSLHRLLGSFPGHHRFPDLQLRVVPRNRRGLVERHRRDLRCTEQLFGQIPSGGKIAKGCSAPEIEEVEGRVGALGADEAEVGGAVGREAGDVSCGRATEANDPGVIGKRGTPVEVVDIVAEGTEVAGVVAEDAGRAERGEVAAVGDVVEDEGVYAAAGLAFHESLSKLLGQRFQWD